MGLSTTRQAYYLARYNKAVSQLTLLSNAYDRLMSADTGDVQSYGFNSGEGTQNTTYKDPDKLLEQIMKLEKHIEWLSRKLDGSGIANINLRRRPR